MEEISARIDWLIVRGYLAIDIRSVAAARPHRLRLRDQTADLHCRVSSALDRLIASGEALTDTGWLNGLNREVIFLLIDRIECSGILPIFPA